MPNSSKPLIHSMLLDVTLLQPNNKVFECQVNVQYMFGFDGKPHINSVRYVDKPRKPVTDRVFLFAVNLFRWKVANGYLYKSP